MALDPGTTRAGLHTAREVISGRQISYPVPYILVILVVLCVICLLIACYAVDATKVVALVLACGSFVALIAISLFSVLFKPELLRSERHEQTMRLIDMIGDPEMDHTTRAELAKKLLEAPRRRLGPKTGDQHD